MPHERFDLLKERLLHAGIAPRHVRRYVKELRDHFDDLVCEEMNAGAAQDGAARAARARIGSDDELSAVMLARPELRSVAARFPWAVFGLGPVLMLPITIVLAVFVQAQLLALGGWWGETSSATRPDWVTLSVAAWNGLATYVAPLLIAALLCALGARQRTDSVWLALGVIVVCVMGAFHEIDLAWPGLTERSTIAVSFALAPPFPKHMIIAGLFRAVVNIALVGVGHWLWLRLTALRYRLS